MLQKSLNADQEIRGNDLREAENDFWTSGYEPNKDQTDNLEQEHEVE